MSDQLPQCSYTDLRRCMGYPVDPAASVPLCFTHLTRVLEDLRAQGARVEAPQRV
jgi:hypothetical protein